MSGIDVSALYRGTAATWATGAELVYAPLAEALVAFSPEPLAGGVVLDVGAGTGAGSRALQGAGARPLAVDLVHDMLVHDRHRRPPAVVGDVRGLPLRSRSVDAVLAPFVLNHLEDPVTGVGELARVTRRGGVVLASVFALDDPLPAKALIDGVAERHGWVPPDPYRAIKQHAMHLLGTAEAMRAALERAGLDGAVGVETSVDVGLADPADVVTYRLSMPQHAAFVASLDDGARDRLRHEAVEAVTSVHDGSTVAVGVVLGAGRAV